MWGEAWGLLPWGLDVLEDADAADELDGAEVLLVPARVAVLAAPARETVLRVPARVAVLEVK